MRTQVLPADECLRAHPQPLGLPAPGPRESCHDDYAECRLMPGGGPADHPASHWGEASHAGAHQVGHTQEEHAPLEKRGHPGVHQRRLDAPADLARVLHLLCPWVPRLPASPVWPGASRSPLAGVTVPQGRTRESSVSVVPVAMLLVDGKSMGELTLTAICLSKSTPFSQQGS